MKKFLITIFLITGLLISSTSFAVEKQNVDFQITKVDLNKNILTLPEFNSLAFILEAHQGPGISFKANNQWQTVEFEKLSKEDQILDKVFSDLYFASGKKVELKFRNKNLIKSLEIFSQKLKNQGVRTASSSNGAAGILPTSDFNIVPRSEWLTSSASKNWPSNYYGIDHIIIHHTASETRDMDQDGDVSEDDYVLMLNSIYNWHANGLGWGDIGYNYIIDPRGNIYEGRAGGDGVIAGHALRDAYCDESVFGGAGEIIGFNHGTVGIAVLGDYHDNQNLSTASRTSLINLIAKLGLEFSLTPVGYNTREGMFLPNIIGHRDVDCTSCPGSNIYSQFAFLRTQAQAKYNDYKNQRDYKATFIGQSDYNLSLKAGESKQVWFAFRNDGNTTWHNYSDVNQDLVYLAESEIKNQLASLGGVSAASVSEDVSGDEKTEESSSTQTNYIIADQANVLPGETAKFYVTVYAPQAEQEEYDWTLTFGSQGYFSQTDVKLNVFNSELFYSAELVEKKFNPAYLAGTTPQIVFKYKNTSDKTWKFPEMRLKVTDKANTLDSFSHHGWTNQNGYIAFLSGEWDANGDGADGLIEPGETATWSFDLETKGPGLFRPMFELIHLKEEVLDGDYEAASEPVGNSQVDLLTRVDAEYAAELVESTIPSAFLTSWRPKVKLTFKNTGAKAWNQNLVLRSYKSTTNNNFQASYFNDSSWNSLYAVDKVRETVEPGQTYTFEFYLDAPTEPGIYTQIYQLEWGSKYEEIWIDSYKQWKIETRVD